MLVCQYVASAQHMYAIIQENLLVWHKISKCTTPPEWNSAHRPQNELLKRNHQERSIMDKAFKLKREKDSKKSYWKTLIKSSEKKTERSPINCKYTRKKQILTKICSWVIQIARRMLYSVETLIIRKISKLWRCNDNKRFNSTDGTLINERTTTQHAIWAGRGGEPL